MRDLILEVIDSFRRPESAAGANALDRPPVAKKIALDSFHYHRILFACRASRLGCYHGGKLADVSHGGTPSLLGKNRKNQLLNVKNRGGLACFAFTNVAVQLR